MHLPQPYSLAALWNLDPNVVFINHGSYGAAPAIVLQKQREIRDQLEYEPLRFFGREWEPLLEQSKQALSAFVSAPASDLVFVQNATSAVNAVLRSLIFTDQDEILVTSHEYNACRNVVNYLYDRFRVTIKVAEIPDLIAVEDEIIDPILKQVTDRTRLFLIDHIVSQTGMIMPVGKLIRAMRERNVLSLIDGAHAPAMLDLSISQLDPDFYTGNCHKWLCAPKGAAFLYVKPGHQGRVRPLVISHGMNSPRTDKSRFRLEFDWPGTHDPSPYLSVPSAIDFVQSTLSSAAAYRAHLHSLVWQQASLLSDQIGGRIPAAEHFYGSMVTIYLPVEFQRFTAQSLHDVLLDRFAIEAQIMSEVRSPHPTIRLSAQLYNSDAQFRYVADCLSLLQSECH